MSAADRAATAATLCGIAAGRADVPPPPDEEALLALVDSHALAGRLARLLRDGGGPPWAGTRLRRRAAELHEADLATLDTHAAAAAELAARLPNGPPVLVKGISTYLATGFAHTIRCGDIDLICADAAAAVAAAGDLGYRRTRDPFLHEIGEFTSAGGIELDLHDHFPVYRYEGFGAARPDPVWAAVGETFAAAPIGHADARAGARPAVVPPGSALLVPDPCVLAIVFSAHAFMNYTNMWSISHRQKPYVRLGELADLVDLAAHPRFDPARFAALVERYGAHDAVAWAGRACGVLLGRCPIGAPEQRHTSRCLWWSFWAEAPVDVPTLVHPWWYDAAQVVDLAGAVRPAGPLAVPRRPGPGVICRSADGDGAPGDWRLDVRREGDRLALTVGLPVDRIRLDLGRRAVEWSAGSAAGDDVPITRTERDVTFRYELDDLRPLRDGGGLPLLAGLAEVGPDGAVTASALVPLRIA